MKIVFEKRKKPQFSKVWLAVCIVISAVCTSASFLLSANGMDPLSDITLELLRTLWGASGTSFLGYAAQNCVRAYTASKYGLPEDSITEEENGDIHE